MGNRARGRGEKRAFFIITTVFVLILASATYLAVSQYTPNNSSSGPPPRVPLYTWRVNVTVQILRTDNTTVTIPLPPNVGISGGLWANHTLDDWGIPGEIAPLHTEASASNSGVYDGFIYIEPTRTALNFTIADFFNIWGQKITDNCMTLPDYPAPLCTAPHKGVLDVEVNTFADVHFAEHTLNQGDYVSILYVEVT